MEWEQTSCTVREHEQPLADELQRSRERIRELQDNIFSLRMSRRVLMSLLEQVQTAQQQEIKRLEKQNGQLQKQNRGYAGRLWEQNRRICELERRLELR